MTAIYWIFGVILAIALCLAGYTAMRARALEAQYPPAGEFVTIEGARIHYRVLPAAKPTADRLPLVMIHGASGSMRDALFGPAAFFAKDRPVILLDRPGLGWSEVGDNPDLVLPSGQARIIARLLDHLDIPRVHVVGHSYGGSVAATFALNHAQQLAGLMFLAPVSHPWPTGIKWYYSVGAAPVLGHLFSWLAALPIGERLVACATSNVFSPNPMPARYAEATGAALLLEPGRFRANARNIAHLYDYVVETAPRYRTIAAPTLIVSGEADTVIFPWIHAAGLATEIPGARKMALETIGHMPHHAAADIVLPAMAAFMRDVEAGRDPVVAPAARSLEVADVAGADECDP